ncbi:MAG TPA: hypothetical protein VFB60_17375 [Ktedonobacteraceae bacterium]|nr:hypothetical protein [Ktedonobacteraceae bacterium]
MEGPEPLPPLTTERQLKKVGFSREQIAGLKRVKALYYNGAAYHEDGPLDKRQAFIRWLYLQGRLQS